MSPKTIRQRAGGSASPGNAPDLPLPVCGAPLKSGVGTCQNTSIGVDGRCVSHTSVTEVLEAVRASQAAGGHVGGATNLLTTRFGLDPEAVAGLDLSCVEGVRVLLAATVKGLAQGRITAGQATALNSLAKTALESAAMVTRRRLEELQQALDQQADRHKAELLEARRGTR